MNEVSGSSLSVTAAFYTRCVWKFRAPSVHRNSSSRQSAEQLQSYNPCRSLSFPFPIKNRTKKKKNPKLEPPDSRRASPVSVMGSFRYFTPCLMAVSAVKPQLRSHGSPCFSPRQRSSLTEADGQRSYCAEQCLKRT